jgi:hypothetical protein
MRLSDFQWTRSRNSVFGLCLCLVLLGLIAVGAAESIMPNDVYSAQSPTAGAPPVIQIFKADPMVLNPDDAAMYSFVVRRATHVQVIEAGNSIRDITNPSGATIKGTAKGLLASALQTADSNTFTAVLLASNESGSDKAALTLSFATELPSTGEAGATDNQTGPRSPKWLAQYSSQLALKRSSASGSEPNFFKCPSDCDYCLKPEEAKSQGMGERCSAERCYYSPDDQQNWYCFKPSPGWCCNNQNVSQATKDECTKMGGAWFLNQSEALDRCQPLGYCCKDGNIFQATRSDCAQSAGTYYADPVEAKERCQPIGYCCKDGNIFQATKSQCAQSGGTYYADAVEAKERCQPIGYCCKDGNIFEATKSQCAQSGGTYYADPVEAKERCQPPCYCCVRGQVFTTTQSACLQSGGNCYSTQYEALERCQPPCWCCAQGKVFQTTQSQCSQYQGGCYSSQSEATAACQRQTTCWCCAGGKVFQSTQAQCSQNQGACYSTQSQADAACRKITTPTFR